MNVKTTSPLVDSIRAIAQPLTGGDRDHDALLARVGDAKLVLLGEASHGTHDFYHERAQITKRLIAEKGFTIVAVEADWPDAYRVNRYVRGAGDDHDADSALRAFERFPTWMWRNRDVLEFVDWLRVHNDGLAAGRAKAGFYGLDVYSLRSSIASVIAYLQRNDPEAARVAAERYGCFDQFGSEPDSYALGLHAGLLESCEDAVVRELVDVLGKRAAYTALDGACAEDEYFYAEQNARIVLAAERYYRTMLYADVSSWNQRDRHMVDTLERLIAHIERRVPNAKAIVWAHNSHLGDASVTDMSARGEFNVGQLIRERYGREAVLVGFTTHTGTVTAASAWHAPAQRKRVRPSLPGSYERAFQETHIPRLYCDLSRAAEAPGFSEPHLERAIGVIYRPDTERQSHYFRALLHPQFDAVFHFDHTRAVTPLEPDHAWHEEEVPETFPTGV